MSDAPFRDAVLSVLDEDLREEFRKAEDDCQAGLDEALAAKGRASELLRQGHFERPLEVLEFELEKEHEELIRYHNARFAKKIRWILQAWKDTGEE